MILRNFCRGYLSRIWNYSLLAASSNSLKKYNIKCLLGPVFFRTALPCSGGYHMEREEMPLHNVVGINCIKGATTENHGSAVKYMG